METRTYKVLSYIFGLICLILTVLGLCLLLLSLYPYFTGKASLEGWGLKIMGVFIFGVPVATVMNAIVACVLNWLMDSQKKFFSAVILPSFLAPIMLGVGFTLYLFVFDAMTLSRYHDFYSYLSDLLKFFLSIYFGSLLIVTVPQLITYLILKEKPSKMRIVISIVLGYFIIFLSICMTLFMRLGTPD
ncbi:MAG: hypothetical protein HY776_04235 [Actinobacteria bacterium]|nr:hypothetical protein [Actinomycetota bacterium]